MPVAAGGYVTAGMLEGGQPRSGAGALRAGERAVELAVAGGAVLAGAAPGARVDVVVSSEGDGGGRTLVALEDAELLGLRAAAGDAASGAAGGAEAATAPGSGAAPTAVATLRVTARQAVYLTAAANFGREIRLLVRPPGDRRRVGDAAVSAAGL